MKTLGNVWFEVIEALLSASRQLLSHLQADPAAGSGAACAELQAALVALQSAVDAMYRGMPASVRAVMLPTENLDSLSEPAAALGAAMERCWEQCGEAQQARVEVAQAAAARACACLGCASFVGGGPAAGEGQGCKRCSGCHTVW